MSKHGDWEPQAMPVLAINRLARMLSKLVDDQMVPLGLTTAQLPVLVALKNGEALPQKDLARLAEVEQPTMAQMLGRMERDGLVHRKPSPTDLRSSLFLLTEQAMAQLEPGRDALRRVNDHVCAGLDWEEQMQLLGLIKRMARNVAVERES